MNSSGGGQQTWDTLHINHDASVTKPKDHRHSFTPATDETEEQNDLFHRVFIRALHTQKITEEAQHGEPAKNYTLRFV